MPRSQVWATYTRLTTSAPFAVVLSANLKSAHKLELRELELGKEGGAADYVAFEANSTEVTPLVQAPPLSPAIPLKVSGKWDFEVWALSPWDRAASGFALLGETDKRVPVSAARFSQLSYSLSSTTDASGTAQPTYEASVVAKGTYSETVSLAWAWGTDIHKAPQRVTQACTLPSNGIVRFTMAYSTHTKGFQASCDGAQ